MTILATDNVVLSEEEFHLISNLVYNYCGINLHRDKKELVRARLAKWLRQGNFRTFEEYINYVLEDKTGREFSILIDSISTNLTSFFREQQHFEFMNNNFLPFLLEQKQKTRDFRIRGWSAGCSSGEEPYSIAIILLEAVHEQGQWDIKLLATDISTRMLDMAKKGIYSKERVATVPPLQKSKYLVQSCVNGRKIYQVTKRLRSVVIFKYLNLIKDWPIKGHLDFIFCRNVMIYFDKPTQKILINRFWDLLNSGGILFTGHAELLTTIEHKFDYIQPTIYMKP
jgi:chemotaxis protein methyltransferase CheR